MTCHGYSKTIAQKPEKQGEKYHGPPQSSTCSYSTGEDDLEDDLEVDDAHKAPQGMGSDEELEIGTERPLLKHYNVLTFIDFCLC